jgi:hypothetical protein
MSRHWREIKVVSDQEELRFRRQAAEALFDEVPNWVPASVREAAPIALSNSNPDVVLRLLTDQRMEMVWRTLRGHDATKLKDMFLAAALLVDRRPQVIPARDLEPPRVELLVLAQRIEEIANELRFRHVGDEIESQVLQELIAKCRSRADASPRILGLLVVDRLRGDNQVRAYLAALVKFTNKNFDTSHYRTVLAIARVALNKSAREITPKMVRGAERLIKVAPEWTPSPSLLCLIRSRKSK